MSRWAPTISASSRAWECFRQRYKTTWCAAGAVQHLAWALLLTHSSCTACLVAYGCLRMHALAQNSGEGLNDGMQWEV